MKTPQKHLPSIGLVVTACALLLALAGCAPTFEGDTVKNADTYALEIRLMTGTDMHTMELNKGDVLKIQFETTKGSLYLKITAPDGASIYQGNGMETTEFTLEIPTDGVYTFCLEGRKAQGSICVNAERKSGPEAFITSNPI